MWTRAGADPAFRDALIDDPLRALADAPGVRVSPDDARRLERMTRDERRELMRELVRRVTVLRTREQWGDRFWSPDDQEPPAGP